MRTLYVSKPFRDYVEMLDYEVKRYEDLLKTVNRKDNPMTDEEWNSSWEYFSNLLEEAKFKYEYVKELIQSSYLTEEEQKNGCNWLLDYHEQELIIWNPKEENFKWEFNPKYEEAYSDALARFYNSKDVLNNHDGVPFSVMVREITFQVTEGCNMACTYCYQHNKKPNTMTFEIAKQFIDDLLDNNEKINTYYDSSKMIGVVFEFIGGEPWLAADLVNKISDYIITELFRRKHRLMIRFCFSICSNGLLQELPEVQNYLRKHKMHLGYNVSIDGSKKLHDTCRLDLAGKGTYDRAIKSALQWKDEIRGNPTSKMTVSPFNVPYIFESLVDMMDKGYYHINFNCVMEEGWKKEHATELYWQLHRLVDYMKEHNLLDKYDFSMFDKQKGIPAKNLSDSDNNPCGGTGNMIAIDWKGDIYPCLRYMENSVPPEVREPYKIGTVFDGINVLPEHKKKISYLRTITRSSQSSEECLNCPISSRCPSCNGYNYEYNGDPGKRTTFVCDITKAESLANYYYWKVKGDPVKMYCPKEWAIDIIGEEEYNNLINMEV